MSVLTQLKDYWIGYAQNARHRVCVLCSVTADMNLSLDVLYRSRTSVEIEYSLFNILDIIIQVLKERYSVYI